MGVNLNHPPMALDLVGPSVPCQLHCPDQGIIQQCAIISIIISQGSGSPGSLLVPVGLRSPEQGFVRLLVVILIATFFEPGKAFRCGFLDLDSFFHGSGSVGSLRCHAGFVIWFRALSRRNVPVLSSRGRSYVPPFSWF